MDECLHKPAFCGMKMLFFCIFQYLQDVTFVMLNYLIIRCVVFLFSMATKADALLLLCVKKHLCVIYFIRLVANLLVF